MHQGTVSVDQGLASFLKGQAANAIVIVRPMVWVTVIQLCSHRSEGTKFIYTQVVGLCPNKTLFIKLLTGCMWSKATWMKEYGL